MLDSSQPMEDREDERDIPELLGFDMEYAFMDKQRITNVEIVIM